MSADIISIKTRQVFREYMTDWVLRQISDEFDAARIDCDLSYQPPVSGARRALVERYYHTVNWSDLHDIKKVLQVFENVLHAAEKALAGVSWDQDWAKRQKSEVEKLIHFLRKDGFQWADGRILSGAGLPSLDDIKEGGSVDTITQCAQRLIGRNPFEIERCYQDMYRAWHYPPGREKIHALGALDMALWDMKGKALNVPVYDLMGGMNRAYLECYTGGGGTGQQIRDQARRAMEAGYRVFRMDAASIGGGGFGGRGGRGGAALATNSTATATNPAPTQMSYPGPVYNAHERVRQIIQDCKDMREGVGPNGDFLIDLHQRLDFPDALRVCKEVEGLEPYLVEDPTRVEQFLDDIPKLRKLTTVPLAAGEEWGQRWDFNKLIENHDLDYLRSTLPNVGGISEMIKVAALCETHAIGIVPHFTGPISTAALVHALGPYSGPVLCEIGTNQRLPSHLPGSRRIMKRCSAF